MCISGKLVVPIDDQVKQVGAKHPEIILSLETCLLPDALPLRDFEIFQPRKYNIHKP